MKIIVLMMSFLLSLYAEIIDLGNWDQSRLNEFLAQCQNMQQNEKTKKISDTFLNTQYKSNTLKGSKDIQEQLVIDLKNVDCFTFIDYVEAMKQSSNFEQFKQNLIQLRYQKGKISYQNRNHFFTDWAQHNDFENITSKITNKTEKLVKHLNQFDDNKLYLEGIGVKQRLVEYIKPEQVTQELLDQLQTGDYIGIYTTKEGLDVSHTGLIIKKGSRTFFRHASSKKKYKKVVDEPFIEYIQKTPGFIVLRAS